MMSSFEDEDYHQKRSSILDALKQNDLESLQTLLDSPKFYTIKDEWGFTLLHMAIREDNTRIFDFLLYLEDYPLDTVNQFGETPLMHVLGVSWRVRELTSADYFAAQLIQKGADVHQVSPDGNPILHCAFERGYIGIAELLIEKGADVDGKNDDGLTPLHMCCIHCNDEDLAEGIAMLLYFGADPTIRDCDGLTAFDGLITNGKRNIETVQENLFFYLFDEHATYNIDAGVLLKAAVTDSKYFDKILEHLGEVVISESLRYYRKLIFLMKPECLQVFIEKFEHIIQAILDESPPTFSYTSRPIRTENFYCLMESKFQRQFTDWLCSIKHEGIVRNFIKHGMLCSMEPEGIVENLIKHGTNELSLTKFICFLLSCGKIISVKDLHLIFRKFGYCELFKILLHMDIDHIDEELTDSTSTVRPRLLYDVNVDVQKMVEDNSILLMKDLTEILPFYAIPNLQYRSEIFKIHKDIYEKVKSQPQIPYLVELSRNAFRKYFIERLNITTSRQFYTLINLLPISSFHKKIITFEVPLY